jgi:hypothetical protein
MERKKERRKKKEEKIRNSRSIRLEKKNPFFFSFSGFASRGGAQQLLAVRP